MFNFENVELGCNEKLTPELEEFMGELHAIDFSMYDIEDLIHVEDNHYVIPN